MSISNRWEFCFLKAEREQRQGEDRTALLSCLPELSLRDLPVLPRLLGRTACVLYPKIGEVESRNSSLGGRGARYDSEVASTGCFSKGPEFKSQHSCERTTVCNSSSRVFAALIRPLNVAMI